jgi:hypothetical protein
VNHPVEYVLGVSFVGNIGVLACHGRLVNYTVYQLGYGFLCGDSQSNRNYTVMEEFQGSKDSVQVYVVVVIVG